MHWQFTSFQFLWTQDGTGEGEDPRSQQKVFAVVQEFPGIAHKFIAAGSKTEGERDGPTPPQRALNDAAQYSLNRLF